MHFTSAQPVHRDKWDHCHEAIELGVVLGKGDCRCLLHLAVVRDHHDRCVSGVGGECRFVLAHRINRKLDLVQ